MVIVESEAVLIHEWSGYIVITAGRMICCRVHAEGRGLRSRLGLSHAKAQRAQRDILTLVALRLYKCYDSVDNVIQELLSYE